KFGEMARSAVRSILATVGLFGLVGLVLAGATGYALKDHRLWASVSAAVALAESLALGFFLGVKRGITRAVIEGIQQFSLGRLVLGQIFSRLMNLPVDGAHGERGSVAAKTLERVPLAQA